MLLLKPSAMAANYFANLAETGFASLKKIIREKAPELKTTKIKIMRVLVITKPNAVAFSASSIILLMPTLNLSFLLSKSFLSCLGLDRLVIVWTASTLWVTTNLEMLGGLVFPNKRLTVCQEGIG
jgi:hypothetical protein